MKNNLRHAIAAQTWSLTVRKDELLLIQQVQQHIQPDPRRVLPRVAPAAKSFVLLDLAVLGRITDYGAPTHSAIADAISYI